MGAGPPNGITNLYAALEVPPARSSATLKPRHPQRSPATGPPVRVKVSPGRVKAEHDDDARVARLRQVPLHEVMSRAEGEARRRAATEHDGPLDSGPTPA